MDRVPTNPKQGIVLNSGAGGEMRILAIAPPWKFSTLLYAAKRRNRRCFILGIPLIPCIRYSSIYEIDINGLKAQGIHLLLLDLDNTLIPYGLTEPEEVLHRWIAALREEGIAPFILSNSRKEKRVPDLAKKLGVPFLRRAGKPKKKGFQQAMQEMGKSQAETAMVGDQIFTDILGANRAGVRSVLVRPLRLDNLFRLLRYALETPFRLGAGKWADSRTELIQEEAVEEHKRSGNGAK